MKGIHHIRTILAGTVSVIALANAASAQPTASTESVTVTGTRIVNGNALAARLFHSAIEAGVTLWKNTPAQELILDGAGAVIHPAGASQDVIAAGSVAHQ